MRSVGPGDWRMPWKIFSLGICGERGGREGEGEGKREEGKGEGEGRGEGMMIIKQGS